MERIIEKKLNEQQLMFKELFERMEERVMQRLGDVVADIRNLRLDLKAVSNDVLSVKKRCDNLERDIDHLKTSLNTLQNDSIASDVLIMNVPNDADAVVAFDKLCKTLHCEQLKVNSVFRVKTTKGNNNKSAQCQPIIAKLKSPFERSKLFKALSELRKENNRQLSLSDLGLAGDQNVSVFECLTPINRDILNTAIRFKKMKLLTSVFTIRGFVYIRAKADDKAIKVNNVDEVNKIVGGCA